MPRPKYSEAYPTEFRDVMRHVALQGTGFAFPEGFAGYSAPGLRTTLQAFLKIVREEGARALPESDKFADGEYAKVCIVRIKDNRVWIENRRNDRISLELRDLMAEQGVTSEVEESMKRVFGEPPLVIPPSHATPQPELEPEAGCNKCGGYGCPECEPPAESPAPAPEPQDSVLERNKKLTDLWLGKGKS